MLGGPALLNGVFELPTHFKNFSNNHTYAKYRKPLKPGQKQLDNFDPEPEITDTSILLNLRILLESESKMCYNCRHHWRQALFSDAYRKISNKK